MVIKQPKIPKEGLYDLTGKYKKEEPIKPKTMIHWKSKPHGAAPVQAEGYFMEHYFYFRSRGNTAAIEFAFSESNWSRDKLVKRYILHTTKDPYSAGFLPYNKCKWLIWKGCFKFMLYRIFDNLKFKQ